VTNRLLPAGKRDITLSHRHGKYYAFLGPKFDSLDGIDKLPKKKEIRKLIRTNCSSEMQGWFSKTPH
jgi:hypothetical protein